MGFDIEAAFLEGKLEIPMYLTILKIMVTLGLSRRKTTRRAVLSWERACTVTSMLH